MTEALHIVCPHCHTTNRVQSAQLGQAPDCGSCHRPLFTGAPAELDATSFDKHVQRSHIPVLVDFWAPWCGPCRKIAPIVNELADDFHGRARVAKVNVDEAGALAQKFGVQAIPTLLIFKGGRVVDQATGFRSKAELAAQLDKVLAEAPAPAVRN